MGIEKYCLPHMGIEKYCLPHMGIEKYCLPWRQASESAGQVGLPVTCQAVCGVQPQPDRQCASCQA
jgi:hypothetical protein